MKKHIHTECFDARPDCFARCGGRCELLKYTVFPDGICPFYKTQEQADSDDLRRRKRLRRLGLFPREVTGDVTNGITLCEPCHKLVHKVRKGGGKFGMD